MAHIIELKTFSDPRGSLTILEKVLPFEIKRCYWIYDLNGEPRGRHRHLETWQALVCLQGKCEVLIEKRSEKETFRLNTPHQVLLLEPEDWHEMRAFENNPLILVLASHEYNASDYAQEPLI